MLTACGESENENPTGSWTSSAPQTVTTAIAGATTATKTVSVDFIAPTTGATGDLVFTADYDVTLPADSAGVASSYKVTASIKGTWAQDGDDKDDYVLTFDRNTLTVNGTDAPELGPVTDEFLSSLAAFTTIEDVKVNKDGSTLSFETEKPDVNYTFVKK